MKVAKRRLIEKMSLERCPCWERVAPEEMRFVAVGKRHGARQCNGYAYEKSHFFRKCLSN